MGTEKYCVPACRKNKGEILRKGPLDFYGKQSYFFKKESIVGLAKLYVRSGSTLLIYLTSIIFSTMLCTQKKGSIAKFIILCRRLTEIRTLTNPTNFPFHISFFLLLLINLEVFINRLFN